MMCLRSMFLLLAKNCSCGSYQSRPMARLISHEPAGCLLMKLVRSYATPRYTVHCSHTKGESNTCCHMHSILYACSDTLIVCNSHTTQGSKLYVSDQRYSARVVAVCQHALRYPSLQGSSNVLVRAWQNTAGQKLHH